MSIANRTSARRLLAFVAASSLVFAACGADETIDAGTPAEEPIEQTTPETLPDEAIGEDVSPEPASAVSPDRTPMTPRTDLVSLQSATPDDVVAHPSDDQQLLIHFVGAAEPCSGAAVTVTETDADVTVVLETGLDPNAAAMSCIAQAFDYEIIITLEAPLGDRTITVG